MSLTEHETFSDGRSALRNADDGVYRYCTFTSLNVEGPHIGAVYVGCRFNSVDLYWAHFNCAILVSCTFEDCVFRGATFSDCRIVDSAFVRCSFVADNLGGPCKSEGSHWYGCSATDCDGWEKMCTRSTGD